MNDLPRAPDMVPRGTIRLSEAFERFCRQTIPQWDDLPLLCVQWDENGGNDGDERVEDPYRLLFVATCYMQLAGLQTLSDTIPTRLSAIVRRVPRISASPG